MYGNDITYIQTVYMYIVNLKREIRLIWCDLVILKPVTINVTKCFKRFVHPWKIDFTCRIALILICRSGVNDVHVRIVTPICTYQDLNTAVSEIKRNKE